TIGSAGQLASNAQATPASDQVHLGLTLRPLTPDERDQIGVTHGLVVESAQGHAAAAGIQQGDVVLAVNGPAVKSVPQLRQLLHTHDQQIALLIQRGNQRIYVPVALG
ncbi:MAG: PDZ domain-containing protein, partial [Steroidobacteraceae bacterium]